MISPILNPDYGFELLSNFSEVTKYDYNGRTKEENPLGHKGISLVMWDGIYSVSINYQSDRVLFKIEDDYYKYINTSIPNESLRNAHYVYFSDTLSYLQKTRKETSYLCSKFKENLPIDYIREEKLKNLI